MTESVQQKDASVITMKFRPKHKACQSDLGKTSTIETQTEGEPEDRPSKSNKNKAEILAKKNDNYYVMNYSCDDSNPEWVDAQHLDPELVRDFNVRAGEQQQQQQQQQEILEVRLGGESGPGNLRVAAQKLGIKVDEDETPKTKKKNVSKKPKNPGFISRRKAEKKADEAASSYPKTKGGAKIVGLTEEDKSACNGLLLDESDDLAADVSKAKKSRKRKAKSETEDGNKKKAKKFVKLTYQEPEEEEEQQQQVDGEVLVNPNAIAENQEKVANNEENSERGNGVIEDESEDIIREEQQQQQQQRAEEQEIESPYQVERQQQHETVEQQQQQHSVQEEDHNEQHQQTFITTQVQPQQQHQHQQPMSIGPGQLMDPQTAASMPMAPNKVLLVLPGGQMILTDLTDEQCGQLNIAVKYILYT